MILLVVIYAIAGIIAFSAVESSGHSRHLYDTIMLFVNFGVLVILFIKYARAPLMNFLYSERDKIKVNIDNLEGQIKNARLLMDAESAKLENIDEHLNKIKESILEVGNRQKNKIIDRARVNADRMIEDAEKESQFLIEMAKKRFTQEMLDLAVTISLERITKEMSAEDNDRVIERFASSLVAVQNSL
jgi:F-type H+-transporting ATPase subunit b